MRKYGKIFSAIFLWSSDFPPESIERHIQNAKLTVDGIHLSLGRVACAPCLANGIENLHVKQSGLDVDLVLASGRRVVEQSVVA